MRSYTPTKESYAQCMAAGSSDSENPPTYTESKCTLPLFVRYHLYVKIKQIRYRIDSISCSALPTPTGAQSCS